MQDSSKASPKAIFQRKNMIEKRIVRGHQFHPDSREKKEWILELSFGNAGPSSRANIYKSTPRSAFKSMSLLGFKKWNRLRAIGY